MPSAKVAEIAYGLYGWESLKVPLNFELQISLDRTLDLPVVWVQIAVYMHDTGESRERPLA